MSAIKGLDVLIKVGTQVVGGQRNASIELSSEPIDTTTKQAGGWTTKVAGIKSWTSSCDGVYFVDDAGIQAVYEAFEGGNEVELEFSNTSGIYLHAGLSICEGPIWSYARKQVPCGVRVLQYSCLLHLQ